MKIREILRDGWRVWMDLTPQVLQIDLPDTRFSSYTPREELLRVPPFSQHGPVSAATLLLKAKQFDDGLMAAIDIAAQRGFGRFPSKAELLQNLAVALGTEAGAVPLLAACRLGNHPVAVPDSLSQDVQSRIAEFNAVELNSKPMGFYRWSQELEAIFRQDRFLQQPLTPEQADGIVSALDRTPGANEAHAAQLRLAQRLTNPFLRGGLRDISETRSFLPPSDSREVRLFEMMFGNSVIPPGFDLMTELIRSVRSDKVKLEPTDASGWYDHQTWSLEPLIVLSRSPEGVRHVYGPRYRKQLEELFRGTLALMRETHAKGGGGGYGGGGRGPLIPPMVVRPDLTVEPLPTMYARRAASYRFVRSVLEESFGNEWEQLHRLTQQGPVAMPLGEELRQVERIFDGAAAVSSYELGMETIGNADATRDFLTWRGNLRTDRDVAQDCRMMIPVFFDMARRQIKVWAVLGWQSTGVNVSYRTPPEVLGRDTLDEPTPTERPEVMFQSDTYEFAFPVMAEVYVTRLLDRDEFRKHCDRFRSRDAILRNLT